jgi:hypothetical protein
LVSVIFAAWQPKSGVRVFDLLLLDCTNLIMRAGSRMRQLKAPEWAYGVIGALFAVAIVRRADLFGPLGRLDIDQAWSAGRALLMHQNPYEVIGPGQVYQFPWNLYYPLTVGVVALPLALLPILAARVVFLLLIGGVFGYAVGRTRPWAWPLILCEPFINAIRTAQWSPLLVAALLLPAWGVIGAIKPNLTLALLAGARSRRQVIATAVGAFALLIVSLLLRPGWPGEWLHKIHGVGTFDPFLLRPGGFLLFAGLLRWRDPDARLLIGMGLIPQTGIWYDALPALLVARNYRETLVLALLSQVAFMASVFVRTQDFALSRVQLSALILWGILLPALGVVLRRGLDCSVPRLSNE